MTETGLAEPRVRVAHLDDVPRLVQLWFETWHVTSPELSHPEPIERWEARFRAEIVPMETVLVVEREDAIAGFMALREAEGYLHLLYVHPASHGRGIGTLLLREAMRRCPSGLRLSTLETNARARRFYEFHGWIAGERTVHPRTGHPSIVYRWGPTSG